MRNKKKVIDELIWFLYYRLSPAKQTSLKRTKHFAAGKNLFFKILIEIKDFDSFGNQFKMRKVPNKKYLT